MWIKYEIGSVVVISCGARVFLEAEVLGTLVLLFQFNSIKGRIDCYNGLKLL